VKSFRLRFEGKNFELLVDGEKKKVGFFVEREVAAIGALEAVEIALSELKLEEKFLVVSTNSSELADIKVSDITEIESSQLTKKKPGFAFYFMES
jgi:hypothetical protein